MEGKNTFTAVIKEHSSSVRLAHLLPQEPSLSFAFSSFFFAGLRVLKKTKVHRRILRYLELLISAAGVYD